MNGIVAENGDDNVKKQSHPNRVCLGCLKIANFESLRKKNQQYISDRLRTNANYPFKLYVRPNGLRCTKQHGKCVGVWFKPLPYDLDQSTARAKISITVDCPNGWKDGLRIALEEHSWNEADTTRENPAFYFDLGAITLEAINASGCISDDGSVSLTVEEEI